MKKIDVVIPVYRPGKEFTELIKRLKKQSYPIHEIHVIHTIGGEFPEEFCREYHVRVTHIAKEEFDHGGTRHMGAELSEADILLFMTQDAMPKNTNLIAKMADAFEIENVGAAYARQLPAKDCDVIERYTRDFNYPERSRLKGKEDIPELGIKTFFCSNVCAAYRKSVYQKMGGFEKKTIFNEDMILAGRMVKAGYQIAYVAEAQVVHSHNYSGVQQFHRNFDLAVSQADHPEVFAGIRSESEGIRLVIQTAKHLLKIGKPHLIPVLVYKSGCKYLGYKMGQNYSRLPLWLVQKCTMNATYWEKNEKS